MTREQQQGVASALLDALTALDVDDEAGSVRAVPVALAELSRLVAAEDDPATAVGYGAMTLAYACVSLVAAVKGVDRLDVIAALRPLFADAADQAAA